MKKEYIEVGSLVFFTNKKNYSKTHLNQSIPIYMSNSKAFTLYDLCKSNITLKVTDIDVNNFNSEHSIIQFENIKQAPSYYRMYAEDFIKFMVPSIKFEKLKLI